MARLLTAEHHEGIEVFSFVTKVCLLTLKGFTYIVGGIGGFLIIASLALPFLLIVGFLLKLMGF